MSPRDKLEALMEESMTGEIQMSVKEADRLGVMRQMDLCKLNFKQASQEMGVSLRHAKRIRKRYVAHGAQGIVSYWRHFYQAAQIELRGSYLSKYLEDKALE